MGLNVIWEGFIYLIIKKGGGVTCECGGLDVLGHVRHA